MSESEDSGPGRREVAHRIFAAEFDDANLSYSESDEERAPNYVVTPTGARANRIFAAGVLTELEQVNDEVLRARVVDPTGAFVVYAGQYQPKPLAFLEAATPPVFVAVTGKARTFEPEDGDRVFTSIRPESISEIDADTRDRWVVQTAEQTIDRIGRMASAKQTGDSGDTLRRTLTDSGVSESDADGIALALDHYGTTGEYLSAVRDLAVEATRVVAGGRDEAGTLSMAPSDGTDDGLERLATVDITATESATADTDESEDDITAVDGSSQTAASDPVTDDSGSDESVSDESVSAGPIDAASADDTAVESDDTPTPAPSATADDTSVSSQSDESSVSESTTEDTATRSEETLGDFETGDESASADDLAETSDTGTTDGELDTRIEDGEIDTGAGDAGADDTGTADTEIDDVDDFDPEFELDEDEREEIEQEYGTDFQSGTEVSDPGEADIETPDPETEIDETVAGDDTEPVGETGTVDEETDTVVGEGTDAVVDEETNTVTESDADSPTATSPEEPATSDSEPAASEDSPVTDEIDTAAEGDTADPDDVDLETAVIEAMADLDSGGGADRDAIVDRVTEQYGVSTEDVETAIQDALMNGQCYEPGDGKLTPI
jgi:RPA family protein